MSDVEFEDSPNIQNFMSSSFKSRTILGSPQTPKMVNFLMRFFRMKNEKSAGKTLVTLAIILFILTAFFCYKLSGKSFIKKAYVNPNLSDQEKSFLLNKQ